MTRTAFTINLTLRGDWTAITTSSSHVLTLPCFPLLSRQQVLKAGLISALDYERNPYLKARICDIIGELAVFIVHSGDWPEILPYTHANIQVCPLQSSPCLI